MANSHSLSLTGASSQFATAGDSTDFQFGTGDFTIMAWVKRASIANNRPILAKSNGTTEGFALFFRNENDIRFDLYNAGTSSITGSTVITSTSTWYHIAVTRSGTTVTIYLNAASDGSGTSSKSITASGQDLLVGKMVTDASYYFDGLIDEVRTYKGIALTAAQIATIKNKTALSPSGITAYWRLNNAYTDSSTGAHTLTPSGSPTFSTTVPFNSYTDPTGAALFGAL